MYVVPGKSPLCVILLLNMEETLYILKHYRVVTGSLLKLIEFKCFRWTWHQNWKSPQAFLFSQVNILTFMSSFKTLGFGFLKILHVPTWVRKFHLHKCDTSPSVSLQAQAYIPVFYCMQRAFGVNSHWETSAFFDPCDVHCSVAHAAQRGVWYPLARVWRLWWGPETFQVSLGPIL